MQVTFVENGIALHGGIQASTKMNNLYHIIDEWKTSQLSSKKICDAALKLESISENIKDFSIMTIQCLRNDDINLILKAFKFALKRYNIKLPLLETGSRSIDGLIHSATEGLNIYLDESGCGFVKLDYEVAKYMAPLVSNHHSLFCCFIIFYNVSWSRSTFSFWDVGTFSCVGI
jgi:hypothetical protein